MVVAGAAAKAFERAVEMVAALAQAWEHADDGACLADGCPCRGGYYRPRTTDSQS